ncbi:rCG29982 [Rattus norvegicus]|uniref:RCG29982 n=1 Tax=Rattus norvegicus TaxID=10116 RepID=A6ILW9_RAT|nr:rCG29982 [Rattus norvegicus]
MNAADQFSLSPQGCFTKSLINGAFTE